jgi:hypothetical protein
VDDAGEFEASASTPFCFGRVGAEGVVGLDANDMGISATAGSIEVDGGWWWVVNLSKKRDLLVEEFAGTPPRRVEPRRRHAISTTPITVLVPGVIYTHRIQVAVPEAMLRLADEQRSLSTGTLLAGDLPMLDKDRDVLTAMCIGYLRAFPHRDPRPRTYQEIVDLLGGTWNHTRVRKQIERFREKLTKRDLYFEGPRANDDLAEYLVANRVLTGDDLQRLDAMA